MTSPSPKGRLQALHLPNLAKSGRQPLPGSGFRWSRAIGGTSARVLIVVIVIVVPLTAANTGRVSLTVVCAVRHM